MAKSGGNYFQQFFSLEAKQRQAIVKEYEQKFLDTDNDIIVNSAAEVLESLGISREKFFGLQVGPGEVDEPWDLSDQLKQKLTPEVLAKDYILFSLPTFGGRHSIPAVICKQKKVIYCLDPLAQGYLQEATDQLEKAIRTVPQLKDYRVITPPSNYKPQQTDNWSCGVHTSADMVGIVVAEEVEAKAIDDPRLSRDSSPATQALKDAMIDVSSGKGIVARTKEQVENYLGIFCLAYKAHGEKLGAKLNDPRLMARQYKHLEIPLRGYARGHQWAVSFAAELKTHRDAATAITEALDQGQTPANTCMPVQEFFSGFTDKDPKGPIKVLLKNEDFNETIPLDMKDSLNILGIELNQILEDLNIAVGESKRNDDVILGLNLQKNITKRRGEEYKLLSDFIDDLMNDPQKWPNGATLDHFTSLKEFLPELKAENPGYPPLGRHLKRFAVENPDNELNSILQNEKFLDAITKHRNSAQALGELRKVISIPKTTIDHKQSAVPVTQLSFTLEPKKENTTNYSVVPPIIGCGASVLGLFATSSAVKGDATSWGVFANLCANIPVWGWALLFIASAAWLMRNVLLRSRESSSVSPSGQDSSSVLSPLNA